MSENLPLLLNGKAVADDDATSPPRSIIVSAPSPPQNYESPHTPTIDTGSRRSSAIAIAAAEAILQDRKKGRSSQYGQQEYDSLHGQPFRVLSLTSSVSLEDDVACADERNKTKHKNNIDERHSVPDGVVQQIISQMPAVIIAAGLNFMMVSRK